MWFFSLPVRWVVCWRPHGRSPRTSCPWPSLQICTLKVPQLEASSAEKGLSPIHRSSALRVLFLCLFSADTELGKMRFVLNVRSPELSKEQGVWRSLSWNFESWNRIRSGLFVGWALEGKQRRSNLVRPLHLVCIAQALSFCFSEEPQ